MTTEPWTTEEIITKLPTPCPFSESIIWCDKISLGIENSDDVCLKCPQYLEFNYKNSSKFDIGAGYG